MTVVGPVAAWFVKLNLAGAETPATLAVTVRSRMILAVNCGAVATPSAPDIAVADAPTRRSCRSPRSTAP